MRFAFPFLALLCAGPAAAQHLPYADVLSPAPQLAYAELAIAEPPPPPRRPETSGRVHAFYGDRLEFTPHGRGFAWDVSAELGSAAHRLWLATSGDGGLHDGLSYVEVQALYSHPIS